MAMAMAMQAARLASRLQRELKMLQTDPPPGVCAWPCTDSLTRLQAQIQGPAGTVYSNGIFKLEVLVPERYPFEPPNVRFVTPIYHPNIDNGGRICLDILTLPPKGAWRPSLNLLTVLASVGLLLADPNPDDGLMVDITAEFKRDRSSFDRKARKWTEQYATQDQMVQKTGFTSKTLDSFAVGQTSLPAGQFHTPARPVLVDSVAGSPLPGGWNNVPSKSEASGSSLETMDNQFVTDKMGHSLNKRLTLGKGSPSSQRHIVEKSEFFSKPNSLCLNRTQETCMKVDQRKETLCLQAGIASLPASNSQSAKSLPMVEAEFHVEGISTESGELKLQNEPTRQAKRVSLSTNKKDEEIHMSLFSRSKSLKLSRVRDDTQPLSINEETGSHSMNDCDHATLLPKQSDIASKILKDIPTVIVSDSESDEEVSERKCSRLSLAQRSMFAKRKAGANLRLW